MSEKKEPNYIIDGVLASFLSLAAAGLCVGGGAWIGDAVGFDIPVLEHGNEGAIVGGSIGALIYMFVMPPLFASDKRDGYRNGRAA